MSRVDRFIQPLHGIEVVSKSGSGTLLSPEALARGRARVAAGESPEDVSSDLASEELALTAEWAGEEEETDDMLDGFFQYLEFNPGQPRDEAGKWTSGGSGTLFHGTTQKGLKNLTPNKNGVVFLTPDKHAAEFHTVTGVVNSQHTKDGEIHHVTVQIKNPIVVRSITFDEYTANKDWLDSQHNAGHDAVVSHDGRSIALFKTQHADKVEKTSGAHKWLQFNPDQPRDEQGQWTDGAGSNEWFAGLNKVGAAMGSNPGGVYLDDKGQKWYVKQYKNPRQAFVERIANETYKAIGVPAPESVTSEDGKLFASKWVSGAKGMLSENFTKESADAVLDGFAADVFLMNWDAVGTGKDNALVMADNSVRRIDQGGSLLFRAQGAPKPESLLEGIGEWESLAKQNADYSSVFRKAKVKDGDALGVRAIKQIDAIVAARPKGGWKALADRVAPTAPSDLRERVGKMLEARQVLLEKKREALVAFRGLVFNPDQPRDKDGKWTDSFTGAPDARASDPKSSRRFMLFRDEHVILGGTVDQGTHGEDLYDAQKRDPSLPKRYDDYTKGVLTVRSKGMPAGQILILDSEIGESRSRGGDPEQVAKRLDRYMRAIEYFAKRGATGDTNIEGLGSLIPKGKTAGPLKEVFPSLVPKKKHARDLAFNPDQARDEHGKWTSGGGTEQQELMNEMAPAVGYRLVQQSKMAQENPDPMARPGFVIGLPHHGGHAQAYVGAYGKRHESQPLPIDIERGTPKECYKNATQLVFEREDLDYAEGFAETANLPGMTFMHAWGVDKDGKVVDPTWDKPEDGKYFGVTYARAEYIKHVFRAKFYGVLGGDEKTATLAVATGGLALRKE